MHQLPDRFFTKDNKAFDKGHIFRREATTWGDELCRSATREWAIPSTSQTVLRK